MNTNEWGRNPSNEYLVMREANVKDTNVVVIVKTDDTDDRRIWRAMIGPLKKNFRFVYLY